MTADGPIETMRLVPFGATAARPTRVDPTIRTPLSAATGARIHQATGAAQDGDASSRDGFGNSGEVELAFARHANPAA